MLVERADLLLEQKKLLSIKTPLQHIEPKLGVKILDLNLSFDLIAKQLDDVIFKYFGFSEVMKVL